MVDQYGRMIDYVRISVTDRCNLRCTYCMPAEGVARLSCADILSYEEIIKACAAFGRLGIKKIKLTGGEPLVRLNIVSLIKALKALPGIEQVTMTTNGVLLAPMAKSLIEAGLDGINVSLDTLDRASFEQLTRFDQLNGVLEGIRAVLALNYKNLKINCVPIMGFNDEQIVAIADFAKNHGVAVRFIELMPIGLAKGYSPLGKEAILTQLVAAFGEAVPWSGTLGNGPAEYWTFSGFRGKIGFIEAMNNKFCDQCNRIRLTSDGFLKLCLHYNVGLTIKDLLRNCDDLTEITAILEREIYGKPKEHHFREAIAHDELVDQRGMSQIGG